MRVTLTDTERAQCASLAALLRASSTLATWSLLLGAIALLALLMRPVQHGVMYTLLAVFTSTATERYFTFRLKLDEHLFNQLARGDIASLHELDQALATLGLRAETATPRPLDARIAGTRRLLLRHAFVVGLQTLAMAFAIVSAALK